MEKFSIQVKINSDRPDFRIFSAYFFGDDFYDYDSDGNSFTVTSRNWTELYMCCRKNSELWFDISRIKSEPLILEVTGQTEQIVNSIAYFLASETNGKILSEEKIQPIEILINKMGDFDLQERLSLSKKSVWRKATEENPYPNLTKSV